MTIQSILKTYEAALNAADIDTILSLYGSEPVFMPQHAPALIGREAVRAGYEQVFKTLQLNVRLTSMRSKKRVIGPGCELHRRAAPVFLMPGSK